MMISGRKKTSFILEFKIQIILILRVKLEEKTNITNDLSYRLDRAVRWKVPTTKIKNVMEYMNAISDFG